MNSPAAWPTLQLDGKGGVELPANLFANLENTTIEAWVKWADFNGWQRFFSYGTLGRDAYIGINAPSEELQFVVRDRDQGFSPIHVGGLLTENEWCHIAAVCGLGGMVNGVVRAPDGAMWFATQGGASRFDGLRFRNWAHADGLADDNVYGVLAETNGVI